MKRTNTHLRRVLLLNPLVIKNGRKHHFLTDWTGSEYPSSLLPPPMEFLYMHAALRRAGAEVDFLDASARHLDPDKAVEFVVRKPPELLIMGTTYSSVREVLDMASKVRRRRPSIRIALFGPPLTIHPELALRDGSVDFVILGEPEKPCVDLVEGRLEENLAFVEAGKIHCLPRVLLEPLDWLPHPSRHLLNPNDYVAPFSKDYPFTVVTTSRGCTHAKCKFCIQEVWAGNRIRYHSVGYVLEEIRTILSTRAYREIFFRDQVFTGDRERILELCRKLTSQGLQVPWRATTRVDCIDEELLRVMKQAGCYQISYGFESSSQKVLDRCCKGITLEQSVRAASLTRAAGIEVVGNFVVGLEEDTKPNLDKIADYAVGLGCDFAQFIPAQVWYDNHSETSTDFKKRHELARLSSRAYRRFYLRLSFAVRILKRSRRPRMMKAVLRSGYRILTERQYY